MKSFEAFLEQERQSDFYADNRLFDVALYVLNAAELRHAEKVDRFVSLYASHGDIDYEADEIEGAPLREAARKLNELRRSVKSGEYQVASALCVLTPYVEVEDTPSLQQIKERAYEDVLGVSGDREPVR